MIIVRTEMAVYLFFFFSLNKFKACRMFKYH